MAIQLGARLSSALRGFLNPDPIDPTGSGPASDWSDFDARRRRYRLLTAFADQDAWSDRSLFAGFDAGAYRAIRDQLGIAHQVAEFWPSHIYAGSIDPAMGDGRAVDSAIPIRMETELPGVREALAELVRRSQLAIVLPILVRGCAVQGDGFMEVRDDAEAGTVRLNVVPAGHVRECRSTSEGAVEMYYLDHQIANPAASDVRKDAPSHRRYVRYEEIVERQKDGSVRYRTYIDGQPHQWPGTPAADYTLTREQMPFVPMVKIQHRNAGLGWGKSEIAPAITNMREVADLASCLTDWSRRVLNSPKYLSGVKNPASRPNADPVVVRAAETASTASWGPASDSVRQEASYLYGPADSRPWDLTDTLPVGDIGGQIDRLRQKLTEDYPELAFEKVRLSGQASGESFREARKPAEDKIRQRRTEYDHGLTRAFQMAITLGGLRGYEHYQGFTLESYDAGRLDFMIDPDRPAFALTQADKIADRTARYAAMKAGMDAGLPLEIVLEEAGYDGDVIAQANRLKAEADERSAEMQRRLMAGAEQVEDVEQ